MHVPISYEEPLQAWGLPLPEYQDNSGKSNNNGQYPPRYKEYLALTDGSGSTRI